MNYVEIFLREKKIPAPLRLNIRRYLEYNLEVKKICKIEESEVLSILNDNLKNKLTVYLHGRLLQNILVLNSFPIDFLS
jgi:hypothetical protein